MNHDHDLPVSGSSAGLRTYPLEALAPGRTCTLFVCVPGRICVLLLKLRLYQELHDGLADLGLHAAGKAANRADRGSRLQVVVVAALQRRVLHDHARACVGLQPRGQHLPAAAGCGAGRLRQRVPSRSSNLSQHRRPKSVTGLPKSSLPELPLNTAQHPLHQRQLGDRQNHVEAPS